MGSNIGVLVGVIVLLLCFGFVALMMATEWSRPEAEQGKADAAGAKASRGIPKKKAAKKPAKKAAPKKKSPRKSK